MKDQNIRLNIVLRQLNISLLTALDFFKKEKIKIAPSINAKISSEQSKMLIRKFSSDDIDIDYISDKVILEMRSDNSILKLNEHRMFQVAEQRVTSTILKDKLTGLTYSYKKLSKHIDDNVLMQIVSIENIEKPNLKYSVLNDFIENLSYDFDIVEKRENGFVIENSEHYSSFIPLSYEKHIDAKKISLTVDRIDKEKNQLFFKSNDRYRAINENNSIDVNDLFVVGNKYNFVTEAFKKIDEDISIILLDYQGYKTSVKAYSYQNSKNLPNKLVCIVTQLSDNKIHLLQDRYSLLSDIYIEGEKYEFSAISLENDSHNNTKYYVVADDFGFSHKLYNNEFESEEFEKIRHGDKITLFAHRVDEKGYVVLNLTSREKFGTFVTIDSIFQFIKKPLKLEEYFYFIADELKKEVYKNKPFSQLFEDYKKRENLWVFSYLGFINEFIKNKIREGDVDSAIEFSDLYLDIEEWMLEGSNFLQNFSPEKRPLIINKAEEQLKNARIRKEALLLIKNNESENYIQDVLKKLRISGYLRDDKIKIFKSLIINTSYSNLTNTKGIVEIILLLNKGDLLDTYDVSSFTSILEYKINIEKYDLNPNFLNRTSTLIEDETRNALENIIKILGLQIILNNKNKNHDVAVLKSAILFRYLSHLTDDSIMKLDFLEKAVDCIVNFNSIELKTDTIADFDLQYFTNFIIKDKSVSTVEEINGKQIYKNNGEIYSTPSGWALLSRQQVQNNSRKELKLNNFKSFFNNGLLVSCRKKFSLNLSTVSNINECNLNWKKYYSFLDSCSESSNSPSQNLIVGQNVKVIAKNYLKNNSKILFLKIIESNFEGEGVISSADVFRSNIEDFEDVINSGDEFNAEIIKIEDKGLTFSISAEIWSKTLSEIAIDDFIDAKVMHITSDRAYLITEKGYFATCAMDEMQFDLAERKVYKFKVKDFNYERENITLTYISDADNYFSEKVVVRSFLERTEIIHPEEVEVDNSSYMDSLVTELINCIENIMYFEEDNLGKVEYLQLLKLLSSINRSRKSYYFDALINYFNNIYYFKHIEGNEVEFNFEPIDEITTTTFKSLEAINYRYRYINLYNKTENISELISLRNEVDNGEELKLINILLAHNLLKLDNPNDIILHRTKDLIFEYLSNEKVNTFNEVISIIKGDFNSEVIAEEVVEEIANLGREGTYREFKTSLVYYAGTSGEDIEKQSTIIMKTIAGFLNAKGGSLFIGVNDKGEIVGLTNDYLYFGKSTTNDKFEREVRSIIVKSFNKEINSQIEIKFLSSQNVEYCEIVIPAYDKPVPYFDKFYQRQGNETRILTGNDLISFFERKLRSKPAYESIKFNVNKIEPQEEVSVGNNVVFNNYSEFNVEQESFDFYSDKKLKNTQLTIDYIIPNETILAYMYIYIDGKYILTKRPIDNNKSAEEIIIYDNFKAGFLLQCYDNGCVNKVEVRTLLEKTLGRLYSNGFSLMGNLIGLFLIKEDCLIVVNTVRNDIAYVKVVDTNIITTHSQLNLKGNNIVQEDFDLLRGYRIIERLHQLKINRICYKSKQSLGVKIDNKSYEAEIKYLNSIKSS